MPLRIGHRGAAGTHPENTMISFMQALELGCDGIEFDVHRTRDGHLIVIHDDTLDRTTSGSGRVADMTLAQVQTADAGIRKGLQFAGERVPALVEVIHSTPRSCLLFLELKAGSRKYPGIEEQVLGLLKAENALHRTQVSSFDHAALRRLHELDPSLSLGALMIDNTLDLVAIARSCGANAVHPHYIALSPLQVERVHKAGLKMNVWTVNEPEAIEAMHNIGVDGIMSDFPDRL